MRSVLSFFATGHMGNRETESPWIISQSLGRCRVRTRRGLTVTMKRELRRRSAIEGTHLERLSATVDFEMFRPLLEKAVRRSDTPKGGRPGSVWC
jgi:hypothetical protein